jgi:hypothetical protein
MFNLFLPRYGLQILLEAVMILWMSHDVKRKILSYFMEYNLSSFQTKGLLSAIMEHEGERGFQAICVFNTITSN